MDEEEIQAGVGDRVRVVDTHIEGKVVTRKDDICNIEVDGDTGTEPRVQSYHVDELLVLEAHSDIADEATSVSEPEEDNDDGEDNEGEGEDGDDPEAT